MKSILDYRVATYYIHEYGTLKGKIRLEDDYRIVGTVTSDTTDLP